ncbi:pentapeptide repeat-containing protein [Nocardiopsis sp. LDBS0036]|uniref:pentapeptide repeat-containing protein n=1 Tax=Nocardiopsis sp. LDBS0036 TaxID=3104276 RepID=UPI0035171159
MNEESGASGMDLRGADLSGTPMRYLCFVQADLSGSVFNGCDFSKSELSAAVLNNSKFVGASFRKADLSECEARGTDFTKASFVGAKFYRSEIFGSCFREAYLNAAWMHETDLRGSDLSSVWLGPGEASGTTVFKEAKVLGCTVTGAGGWVRGTVDVGTESEPRIIGGPELVEWFRDNGAPDVRVVIGDGCTIA